MPTRANIRHVAQRAGVSKTTVSNVLLGRHAEVSAETCEIVLKAVRELEYVPIRPTLQNRHIETHVIAVPMDDPCRLEWEFHAATYRGVCEGGKQYGYDILNLVRPNPEWALERREMQFLDRRSDGIIFALPDTGEIEDTYEMLARNKIPTVVCYRRNVPDGIAWVDPDNQGAMYGAVAHLIERGHRRIAYLTVPVSQFDVSERYLCFKAAVERYGLTECGKWILESTDNSISPQLVENLQTLGATAVVCFNDGIALELWRVLNELGLSVPEDISIIGVDNLASAKEKGLNSMGFSWNEIGVRAVESLCGLLQGQTADRCSFVQPVQLHTRISVKDLRS